MNNSILPLPTNSFLEKASLLPILFEETLGFFCLAPLGSAADPGINVKKLSGRGTSDDREELRKMGRSKWLRYAKYARILTMRSSSPDEDAKNTGGADGSLKMPIKSCC